MGVTEWWGLGLSYLKGKFQGSGNPSSNVVRCSRKTSLVVPYGLKKWSKRALLKEPIEMVGKLPPDCLVAVKDSKREGLVEDDEVPISVKLFRDLLLNMFREIFEDCKVVTMIVDFTSRGEGGNNWVIRPDDSPSAGRIIPSFASEFPLRERCKKVGDVGGGGIIERKIVGITVKDATEDGIISLRWKRNLLI